jgi:heme/copper-type cytochrome/quinol oxidase subunit 3
MMMMSASPAVVEHHHDSPEVVGRRQRLGLLLLIAADVAFVLSMVFTWFYLRGLNTSNAWIAPGGRILNIVPGWLMAAITLISWLVYQWGERGARRGEARRLVVGSLLALVLLLAVTGWQINQIRTLPFAAVDSAYASSVVLFAWSALLHEILTVFLGLAIWNRARMGLFTAENHWHVRLVGYWWLWITVSAVLAAATMSFAVSPNVSG